RITHHERHFCAAEFREINPTEKSDRNTYQRGQQEQFGAADDRIGHPAASLAHLSRQFGEEIPVNRLSPVVDEISKNKKQYRNSHQRAHAGHGQHKATDELPPSPAPPRVDPGAPTAVLLSIPK